MLDIKNNIDILRDIGELVKGDNEHRVRIETDYLILRVLLDYDPTEEFEQDCTIPIEYTTLEEFAYIPHDKLVELYHANDFGIDSSEIKLIGKIMDYMEQNGREIDDILINLEEPKGRNTNIEDVEL